MRIATTQGEKEMLGPTGDEAAVAGGGRIARYTNCARTGTADRAVAASEAPCE